MPIFCHNEPPSQGYEFILFEKIEKVGIISLNRPHSLNALCEALMQELSCALARCERDTEIHCIILRGSDTVFAAGADIKEMQNKTYMEAYKGDFITKGWEKVASFRKPIIAS